MCFGSDCCDFLSMNRSEENEVVAKKSEDKETKSVEPLGTTIDVLRFIQRFVDQSALTTLFTGLAGFETELLVNTVTRSIYAGAQILGIGLEVFQKEHWTAQDYVTMACCLLAGGGITAAQFNLPGNAAAWQFFGIAVVLALKEGRDFLAGTEGNHWFGLMKSLALGTGVALGFGLIGPGIQVALWTDVAVTGYNLAEWIVQKGLAVYEKGSLQGLIAKPSELSPYVNNFSLVKDGTESIFKVIGWVAEKGCDLLCCSSNVAEKSTYTTIN